ncbi:hypothetical protein KP509_37G002700 [Ceratopteris richardii]|uniref:Bifunctional inhibitor/plant lipid transfer protein/seed storage helical domain-containing protein n=1 Tax=Ceratopteris richardii TaxID=49495 RepID=A0A8T2Q547_CERRI|nr:hypothetical protein KP509_37G002700 [Ceratopteris richardii]
MLTLPVRRRRHRAVGTYIGYGGQQSVPHDLYSIVFRLPFGSMQSHRFSAAYYFTCVAIFVFVRPATSDITPPCSTALMGWVDSCATNVMSPMEMPLNASCCPAMTTILTQTPQTDCLCTFLNYTDANTTLHVNKTRISAMIQECDISAPPPASTACLPSLTKPTVDPCKSSLSQWIDSCFTNVLSAVEMPLNATCCPALDDLLKQTRSTCLCDLLNYLDANSTVHLNKTRISAMIQDCHLLPSSASTSCLPSQSPPDPCNTALTEWVQSCGQSILTPAEVTLNNTCCPALDNLLSQSKPTCMCNFLNQLDANGTVHINKTRISATVKQCDLNPPSVSTSCLPALPTLSSSPDVPSPTNPSKNETSTPPSTQSPHSGTPTIVDILAKSGSKSRFPTWQRRSFQLLTNAITWTCFMTMIIIIVM